MHKRIEFATEIPTAIIAPMNDWRFRVEPETSSASITTPAEVEATDEEDRESAASPEEVEALQKEIDSLEIRIKTYSIERDAAWARARRRQKEARGDHKRLK